MDELINKNEYVYYKIRKGMYGLEEAGCVALQNLVNTLADFGYEPMPCTPGLWRHNTRCKTFTLQYMTLASNISTTVILIT